MKILFDTNVIIDVLGQREPYYNDSRRVFKMAREQKITGIVGAGSIADIYYLVRKNYHDSHKALQSIIDLITVLIPVDTKSGDIQDAVKLAFPDFEDAIIAATAAREQAAYIITRNIKDFEKSPVKPITPAEFLAMPETILMENKGQR